MNTKKMIEEAMNRIMHVREMQEAYLACTTALQRKHSDYKLGDGKVFNDLIAWELEEWRGLLMWGMVIDQETKDRIKAAAHERFLSNRMDVSKWFNNGIHPNSWLIANEKDFREMAKEAFSPKDNE